MIFAAAMAETLVEAAFVAFCTPPDFTVSVDAVFVAEVVVVEFEVVLCMTVAVFLTTPPPPPTVAAADLVVEAAAQAEEDEERDAD